MDAPASEPTTEGRGSIERLLLAGIGWASLAAAATDELADALAQRLSVDRAAMRTAVQDTMASWRHEAEQLGTRREDVSERMLGKMGLVRREEIDDLALRIAQLEHRLRLLEKE
jgi:polyhydroxyalkanoate synthesis regulator phasin